jgi:hypothetical protein
VEIKTIDCQQGSEEWLQARVGIVTCSELKHVLAKGEGKTRSKYMRQLAGEILTGKPAQGFQGNSHTERGKEQEPEARKLINIMFGEEAKEIGFIRNDTLRLGCSPDGLLGVDWGLEIKCCLADIQVERLFAKGLPSEHRVQVEGSIIATGRPYWKFFSFCPGMPTRIVDVTVTDERRREIEAELRTFNTELDEMVTQLKGMY